MLSRRKRGPYAADRSADDPFEPVLTRLITSSTPVATAWWMPGAWIGNGCHLAGVEKGDLVDEAVLEQLVAASGGAFDVAVTEPIPLIRELLTSNRDRHEPWFVSLINHAASVLPGALDELWTEAGAPPDLEHVKIVGAVFAHPISCCWPKVSGDRYHAHVIVPGQVWCDKPGCTIQH
jgi:hypothetical protein